MSTEKKKKKKKFKEKAESVKSKKKKSKKTSKPAEKTQDKKTKASTSTDTAKKAEKAESGGETRHSNKPKAIRISMRIAKKVTSITLNPNMVGLWLVFCTEDDPSDQQLLKSRVNEFVGRCMKKWDREDAKGLSEYIANRMMKDCLDEKDFKLYRKFIKTLTTK